MWNHLEFNYAARSISLFVDELMHIGRVINCVVLLLVTPMGWFAVVPLRFANIQQKKL